MHSIVVTGDARTHILLSYADPDQGSRSGDQTAVYGGVLLVRQLVENILKHSSGKSPKIFSLDKPNKDVAGTSLWRWDVRPTLLDGDATTSRPRLKNRVNVTLDVAGDDAPQSGLLPVSTHLKRALCKRNAPRSAHQVAEPNLPLGVFAVADGAAAMEFDYPDILVIDDLDEEYRKLPVNIDKNHAKDPFENHTGDRRDHQVALEIILSRMRNAVKEAQEPPRLGPLIVCSVSGRLPVPTIRTKSQNTEPTLWDVLHATPELADRTIVIVDADDLRTNENMAISTGTSWERTVQETIGEFRRVESARSILKFSQVIVRFGVTGALHISRHRNARWSYRLYFDPLKDDRAWTNPEAEGIVLGTSGVFVASTVLGLCNACDRRGKNPVLSDLSDAISDAIPSGIRGCQLLISRGYPVPDHNDALLESFEKSLELPGEPLFAKHNFKSWLKQKLRGGSSIAPLRPIAEVDVPELHLSTWSIMRQATQSQVGKIAFSVVQKGADKTLNSPAFPADLAVDSLTSYFSDVTARLIRHRIDGDSESKVLAELDGIFGQYQQYAWAWLQATWPLLITKPRRPELFPNLPPEISKDMFAPLIDEGGTLTREHNELKQVISAIIDEAVIVAENYRFTDPRESYGLIEDLIADGYPKIQRAVKAIAHIDKHAASSDYTPAFTPFTPIPTPVVKFGQGRDQYMVVDRREIEGLNSIRKLISSHLDRVEHDKDKPPDDRRNRPLSFAVFGPPGAGKSSAVKSIISGLSGHKIKTEKLDPFNLAQFTGEADLLGAFDKILQSSSRDKIPIAFFDEFDSQFDNKDFGWLKFFLSPMEDGKYREKPVNNAILVFAGGTSATFSDFSLVNRPSTDQQSRNFVLAKGPDFVSRLHGFLDIVGVNPVDGNDDMHLIRRAIIVRNILERIQGKDQVDIDPDILRAILLVPHYKHGVRSLNKLLEKCSRTRTQRVEKNGIPVMHELNMFVDGKAFWDLVEDIGFQMRET